MFGMAIYGGSYDINPLYLQQCITTAQPSSDSPGFELFLKIKLLFVLI